MLIHQYGISQDQAARVVLKTVWPNLTAKEPCTCKEKFHQRFDGSKPQVCLKAGTSQAPKFEKPGWHVFKEDAENCEDVLRSMMKTENEIDPNVWKKILTLHTRLSCGVLFDEMSKKFFLLGPEQKDLRDSAEHLLSEPRLIEGRAGTGKSLTIAAKIEQLSLAGKISSKRKALYLCYSPQMVQQMTLLLNNAGVDMTNIQIVNAKEEKKYRYLIENQD